MTPGIQLKRHLFCHSHSRCLLQIQQTNYFTNLTRHSSGTRTPACHENWHATPLYSLLYSELFYSSFIYSPDFPILFSARPFVYRKFLNQPSFEYLTYANTKLYLVNKLVHYHMSYINSFLFQHCSPGTRRSYGAVEPVRGQNQLQTQCQQRTPWFQRGRHWSQKRNLQQIVFDNGLKRRRFGNECFDVIFSKCLGWWDGW